MKAALLYGLNDIRVEEVESYRSDKNQILLKVHACAICGADLRTYNFGNDRIKYPAIIGHEIAGEIIEVGESVKNFKVGDRIALGASVPNMEEDWGKNGLSNLCDNNYAIGYQFPGGFAEYCLLNKLTVKYGPLFLVPDHISYEEAALSEPLACCINGFERSFMEPGKSVLIVGAGPIGVMLYKLSQALGSGVVVLVDNEQSRIEQAKELGISNVFNSNTRSYQELDRQFNLDKKGFDIIFTACSSPEVQEAVIDVVAKRGVINLFAGLPKGARKISLFSNTLHYKEAYLTGSHGASVKQFKLAVNMIANKRIDLSPLITHRFSLNDIEKAFETAITKTGLKVMITPNK